MALTRIVFDSGEAFDWHCRRWLPLSSYQLPRGSLTPVALFDVRMPEPLIVSIPHTFGGAPAPDARVRARNC
jgi:hypothetical protein